MPNEKTPLALPGAICQPDDRKVGNPPKLGTPPSHAVEPIGADLEFNAVHSWLTTQPIGTLLRDAVDSAVKYVLDGARTWRFDLMDPAVDSDERASVGTKLQYHVIQKLGLKKEPPLDTTIVGVAVEIKGTTRDTWMIPREGQCAVTLLIKIDSRNQRFSASLMRTHRVWLTNGKGNGDRKRSPTAQAFAKFSLPVVPWTALPAEPLRLLSPPQLELVFAQGVGLRKRLVHLFEFLPEVVIPRGSIATVGAGLDDPLRRARDAKIEVLANHDMYVLVGTWPGERELARSLGHDIGDGAWVAIPRARFLAQGLLPPAP